MMTEPIIPPPELVEEWIAQTVDRPASTKYMNHFATRAAQWGADQELEACCEYMQHEDFHGFATELRAARRPKLPSLKEQAQSELDRLIALIPSEGALAMAEPIRRALEALDD